MKNKIRNWIIKFLRLDDNVIFRYSEDSCGIVEVNGYWHLTSPDGKILPHQTEMKIDDDFPNRDRLYVTVKLRIDK